MNRKCHSRTAIFITVYFLAILSYIYETNVGSNMPSYKDYKYGVEYMFISLLAKSKFRTKVRAYTCMYITCII